MIRISIVTPSFNQAAFLEQTIDSVLSQGYSDVEYVIIDGGSTDGSTEIIKKHEKHLKYWISEPDRGQSHAINKGLKFCTGDVFNWINSDDYLEPGGLKTIAKVFENPELNVFVGRSNIVREGKIIRQSRGTDVYPGNLPKTIGQARIDQPEHWWRKSVIDKIGLLNENLHFIMDRDWWIRYLLMYGLEGVEKSNVVLANFRLHGQSKTVGSKESFSEERNAYFYSLAEHYGLEARTRLESFGTLTSQNPWPKVSSLNILESAFQYFFLLLGDEAYVKGDRKAVKKWMEAIDAYVLNEEDRELYRKLKFRSKLLSPLIDLARKMKP